MKKIYTIIVLLGAIVLGSCSDFLDETTDKSGSAYTVSYTHLQHGQKA